MAVNRQNFVNYIMRYEEGKLTERKVIELFSYIIKMHMDQWLQGHYGRTANDFIQNGIISRKGRINWKQFEKMKEEMY